MIEVDDHRNSLSSPNGDMSQEMDRSAGHSVNGASRRASDQNVTFHSTNQSSVRLKLPRPELPKFGGNQLNFYKFWDSYKHMVHDRTGVDKVEKMQLLSRCLSGDAAELIKGLPLTDESYSIAIDLLQGEYGSTDKLKTMLYDSLSTMKRAEEDVMSLKRTSNHMEKLLRQLECLGEDVKSGPSRAILLREIQSKIPERAGAEIEKQCPVDDWTVTSFMDALRLIDCQVT